MITSCASVSDPIELMHSKFYIQLEFHCEPAGKHSWNRVHSRGFECMHGKKFWAYTSQHTSQVAHNIIDQYIPNQFFGGFCAAYFGFLILRMTMDNGFRGANQNIGEITPPCSIKIPPDLAQVHASIIRQPRQVARRE